MIIDIQMQTIATKQLQCKLLWNIVEDVSVHTLKKHVIC